VAARAHLEALSPTLDQALQEAGISIKDVDAIAVANGPGLAGALMVGIGAAKGLAVATGKPLYAVNHLVGHVGADVLERGAVELPTIALLVSGGHTSLLLVRDLLDDVELLGETIDDAAGEAFDKSAKLLGLPYPGGPLIDKYAKEGNPAAFRFPEPQIPGLNFSFSGLKTSILYFLQNAGTSNVFKESFTATPAERQQFIDENLADICASIQQRIISILLNKLKKAAAETGIKEICIAGGVSANSGLRKSLQELGEKMGWNTYIPPFQYCTDNAGMIAIAGHYKFLENDFSPLNILPTARAEW
jgi:N6-L-threonylcarbamoyladenine synthase